MKKHAAFTMIELIFVIVVMGIIGKFGVEFLAQAYKSFIFSNINNTLQSNSATTVEFIASRLQNRIKDSVIARESDGTFMAIGSIDTTKTYTTLEWVGSGIDSFRGLNKPMWSGIIDLNNANADINTLVSPDTNTSTVNAMIDDLSDGNSGINDAAIYFIGSNNDINAYGWDGTAITDHNSTMHPIKSNLNDNQFVPRRGDNGATNSLAGVDIYEYYKLAWTAYAIVYTPNPDVTKINMGTLTLWYDYQPWNGETYTNNGKSSIIMENVSTFKFVSIGSLMKIQVCVKSNLLEEYSLCKEKTVF